MFARARRIKHKNELAVKWDEFLSKYNQINRPFVQRAAFGHNATQLRRVFLIGMHFRGSTFVHQSVFKNCHQLLETAFYWTQNEKKTCKLSLFPRTYILLKQFAQEFVYFLCFCKNRNVCV